MTESKRFSELIDELIKLRKSLLPEEFDPTGNYPPEIFTRAFAFQVMIHAEIESYIEDRVREAAQEATRYWDKYGQANRTVLGLIAFSDKTMERPPESLTPEQPSQKKDWPNKLDLSKKIASATRVFYSAIENNHGVKEKNLLRLLLPIGIEVDSLDQVWIADMNSFSNDRGEFAHNSATKYRAKQEIDPESVLKKAESLLLGLRILDAEIEKIIKDLHPNSIAEWNPMI